MPSLRIVSDTNALLRCISWRSVYAVVLDKLYTDVFELYLSTEVLLEYGEKVSEIFSPETAELVIGAFSLLNNVKAIDIHFCWNLIAADPEDNKFADCAFAANARYLVINDKHFNILK